jgi:hypothetical protein
VRERSWWNGNRVFWTGSVGQAAVCGCAAQFFTVSTLCLKHVVRTSSPDADLRELQTSGHGCLPSSALDLSWACFTASNRALCEHGRRYFRTQFAHPSSLHVIGGWRCAQIDVNRGGCDSDPTGVRLTTLLTRQSSDSGGQREFE